MSGLPKDKRERTRRRSGASSTRVDDYVRGRNDGTKAGGGAIGKRVYFSVSPTSPNLLEGFLAHVFLADAEKGAVEGLSDVVAR